jgi:hypothetical protein
LSDKFELRRNHDHAVNNYLSHAAFFFLSAQRFFMASPIRLRAAAERCRCPGFGNYLLQARCGFFGLPVRFWVGDDGRHFRSNVETALPSRLISSMI